MPPDIDWHQYLIEFTDRATAEQTTAHELAPALNQAQYAGELDTWWYIRKTPAWRLRYRPTDPDTTMVDTLLIDLAASGHIASWTRGIYEPETLAFGGHAAMTVAHTLFHQDSQHFLARAAEAKSSPALGQRETTVLLYSAMLHAAGLDWFEQGDVWAKVTALRPASHTHYTAPERAEGLSQAIRRLMTADPRSVPDLLPESWLTAFDAAGQQLAALARHGRLERGIRAVLAHHFVFHANRAGLSGADQINLAALAVATVFHTTPQPAGISRDRFRHDEGSRDDNHCQ
ncbi:MAG: thiopeptide-type bacteriocin biosynthesis protein [Pseudonocardiaceae bacterium]